MLLRWRAGAQILSSVAPSPDLDQQRTAEAVLLRLRTSR